MPRPLLLLIVVLLAVGTGAQEVRLQAASGGTFRFKDILGQTFSTNYINGYSYSKANVTVTVNNDKKFLSGTVNAAGLKPNFAYQVKLIGRPLKGAVDDSQRLLSDDATNERLGKIGRWWRVNPSPANSNDSDYEANKNRAEYIYEGYLIMAFFVTDASGNATAAFLGNNSYHVLWRTDQRPASSFDGPLLPLTLPATSGNTAYDSVLPERLTQLYGEYEPTRALPGLLEMPLGRYRCDLVLTEESFHDATPNAGNWAAAMRSMIEFEFPATLGPGTTETATPLQLESIRAALNLQKSASDSATVSASLGLPENFVVENHEVELNIFGVTRRFVLDKRGRSRSADGKLSLKRDRRNPQQAEIQMNVRGVSLAVFNAPTEGRATVNATLSIKLGGLSYIGSADPTIVASRTRARLTFKKK
jgi:hypothetical protein